MSIPSGVVVPVTEPPLQRLRMSWEEYLALPERPRAEWVDGEVVVTPQVGFAHGHAAGGLIHHLRSGLPGLYVVTEVGLWLPGNRLRGPDVMVVADPPAEQWVRDAPVLVAEVLSPSTRSEDTVRKSVEYLAGGVGQYWIIDPDHREVLVHEAADGAWELLLTLDDDRLRGEVAVGAHGTVALDLADLFLPLPGGA